MARHDISYVIRRATKGIDGPIKLHARDPKYYLNTFSPKLLNKSLPPCRGHARLCLSAPLLSYYGIRYHFMLV